MTDFISMLNWQLLAGSHEFPGPDGGTCINEAAVIAAGFKYRAIKSYKDFPPCFSIVIGSYALALNDRMPDKVRNELLLPFVTRLAGTADTWEVELKRLDLIIRRMREEYDADANADADAVADANAVANAIANAANAANAAAYAAAYAAFAAAYAAAIWNKSTSILNDAILLGNHQTETDHELVIQRLAKARELAKVGQ